MSNTAAAHEEHHLIQQAYEAMLDVSDYINEVSGSSLHFGGKFKWNAIAGEAGLGAAADHPGDPEEHHGVEHAARARAEGLRPPQEGQRAQGGVSMN